MSGSEDQPPTAGQIKCKLSKAVPFEWVRVARNQISDTRRCFQRHQPHFQLACRGRPELFLGDGLFFAQLADFLVLVSNFQGTLILSVFTC